MQGLVCIDSDEEDVPGNKASPSASQLTSQALRRQRVQRVRPAQTASCNEPLAIDLEAEVPPLRIGVAVKVHGLRTATVLNGIHGICEALDVAKGRWIVRLQHGEQKSLKAVNLQAQASLSTQLRGASLQAQASRSSNAPLAPQPTRSDSGGAGLKEEAPSLLEAPNGVASLKEETPSLLEAPNGGAGLKDETPVLPQSLTPKAEASQCSGSSMSRAAAKAKLIRGITLSTLMKTKLSSIKNRRISTAPSPRKDKGSTQKVPCCRNGHPLVCSKIGDDQTIACDLCLKDIQHGSQLYSCRQCNYDVCEACIAKVELDAAPEDSRGCRQIARQKRKALWGQSRPIQNEAPKAVKKRPKAEVDGRLSANRWENSNFGSADQKDKFLRLMGGDKLAEAVLAGDSDDEDIPPDGDLPTFELSEGQWVEDLVNSSGRCRWIEDLTDGAETDAASPIKQGVESVVLEKLFRQGNRQKENPRRGLGSA